MVTKKKMRLHLLFLLFDFSPETLKFLPKEIPTKAGSCWVVCFAGRRSTLSPPLFILASNRMVREEELSYKSQSSLVLFNNKNKPLSCVLAVTHPNLCSR